MDALAGFLLLLTKPYRFAFLEHIQQYLSNDDLGAYLRYVWINGEYTNAGIVFTKKQLTKLFRRSSKSTLMDEEERRVLEGLPERITVYRGLNYSPWLKPGGVVQVDFSALNREKHARRLQQQPGRLSDGQRYFSPIRPLFFVLTLKKKSGSIDPMRAFFQSSCV